VPAPIQIARKQERTVPRDGHLATKGFDGQRSKRNFGGAVRSFRVRDPDDRVLKVYLILLHRSQFFVDSQPRFGNDLHGILQILGTVKFDPLLLRPGNVVRPEQALHGDDAGLGKQIDAGPGRSAFIQYIMAESETLAFTNADPAGPWQAFVMRQVVRAVNDGDLTSFVGGLRGEPWILADACVRFQVGLIEQAVLRDREAFITALLDLDPAVLRRREPPPSQAIEFVFTYAKTRLLPALLRIWRLPDDLPHAAGNGDLARVRSWFDAEGKPALGDLTHHSPANSVHRREPEWGEPSVQQVLDTALAWAVINNHFEIADFLLGHGADINTNWSSHEPASLLHELVFHKNYEAMQFLIDRGIDMTIVDYRWRSTAQGWASYAVKDEKMTQWLREAQQRREQATR
jgi:Ankyrin repeats (many copies)